MTENHNKSSQESPMQCAFISITNVTNLEYNQIIAEYYY